MGVLERTARVFEPDWNRNRYRFRQRDAWLLPRLLVLRPPGVMDGFLKCLLGFCDLYIETGDSGVRGLSSQASMGFGTFSRDGTIGKMRWSKHANRHYLCPRSYHCMNFLLLGLSGCDP